MSLYQIILFCLLTNLLVGQEKNPFDISATNETEPSSVIPEVETGPDVSDDNPFNVSEIIVSGRKENPKKEKTNPISPKDSDRFTPLTLTITGFSLILMALGINSNRSRFNKFLKSLINTNQLKGLRRSDKGMLNVQDLILYVVFALNVSLLLYLLINNYGLSTSSISWPYLLIMIVGVYLFRHMVQQVISGIFTFPKESNLHGFSLMVHNICIGVLLLPILLGLQFGPDSFYSFFFILGISIVVLIYILRQGKGLLFAIGIRGFNLMYFFLYLCAVEVAPVMILLKGLSQNA